MEVLILAQHEVYQRIGRTYENLKKSGIEKIELGRVQSALQQLDKKWALIEEQHASLRNEHWVDLKKHEYYTTDFISTAEGTYLVQRGKLLELERALKPRVEETKQAVETSTTVARRAALPKIRLPQFSGKYEDWPAFRDHFISTIDSDDLLPPIEKLHYLRSCVQGEAASMIRNLPATEASYKKAWKELSDFFENTQLLVRSYISKFLSLHKMKNEDAVDLKKIFHSIVNTYDSLENIGRPVSCSEDLFVHLIVDLLGPRTRDLWDEHISVSSDPPSYETLKTFLQRRLQTLDGRWATKVAKADTAATKSTNKTTKSHTVQKKEAIQKGSKERCTCCKKDHYLMFCESFKGKSAAEKRTHVSENNLCFNCLGKHKVKECLSKKSCTVCNERHHTLLHDTSRENRDESSEAITSHVARHRVEKRISILLATARVRVADRFGLLHNARALVDQGSETSFVSEALVQRLKLPRRHASVSVIGVGGKQTGVSKGRVTCKLLPHFSNFELTVDALVLPRLSAYTGGSDVISQQWQHLKNLELADPNFLANDTVDILLGADVFGAIVKAGLQKGAPDEPIAQQTVLGWIISGNVTSSSRVSSNKLCAHQCIKAEALTELVRRFWEQEELPQASSMTEDEQKSEESFVATHTRNAEGRYVVRLPLVREPPDLSATKQAAMSSLFRMETRFTREPELHTMYSDFMRQYEELAHMSPAIIHDEKGEGKRTCYLPHHGVIRDSSLTTKLRVVFNGSQLVPSGESLNANLRIGENLLPALTDILLQWRAHRFVLATDIEKMYRQILIHPDDRDLQRILWRYDATEKVQDYKLNTVTYGLACAPFLALRTLQQLAQDEEQNFPLGAAALKKHVYVDDILTGADTMKETQELQKQLLLLCKAGGFPLKKWTANHEELLESVPEEDRMPFKTREWQPRDCQAMLGVRWNPNYDSFAFTVKDSELKVITKRTVLSKTAQLFDPLGWLAPVVIQAKILIQTAWIKGLGWDTPLDTEDTRKWQKLQEELPSLERVRVPRWMPGCKADQVVELHGFADASERAYAAVVYLRSNHNSPCFKISLIAAKTKVAPLKQVSLPRLELSAATLLAQLITYLQRALSLTKVSIHVWLDSTVALSWVQGHPSKWKTFVANRVAEIQRLLPEARWHHVRSRDNPADCASRGVSPSELVNHHLWWQGPTWLSDDESNWPASSAPQASTESIPEERKFTGLAQEGAAEPELLLRYSSLNRLLRVTAWCRRWQRGRQSSNASLREERKGYDEAILTVQETDAAMLLWVRLVQAANYKAELTNLKKGEMLPKKNSLAKLTPFIDTHGILRVGGRLKHAILSHDEKHPTILPAHSHLTLLIIDMCHRKTLHGGVQQTLGLLRHNYWIPQGRRAVKGYIHQCLTCVRWRAATSQQLMADLPAPRVTPSRPFQHTGVDYAGPIMLRTAPGRGHKAYKAFLVVFICLSTKAVHLDVASDYSAEAFLAAFRRFVSRRGLCQTLYSDCGTNFVGADAHLRSVFSAGSQEARVIAKQLATDRVQWRFNPPSAPHFGGIWEAAVKSMKHHVRRVLGDTTLTYEEMATLLAQVEACLNSRPLQALTDDHEDIAALTPGHFLVGTALNAVPEKSLLDASTSALTRWRLVQQMRDHFWQRWLRECLHNLTTRSKWHSKEENYSTGRLCLITSESTPPSKWPLARIAQVHPGNDGRVRVVTVKTATSELVRPIHKLVLLPCMSTVESSE